MKGYGKSKKGGRQERQATLQQMGGKGNIRRAPGKMGGQCSK